MGAYLTIVGIVYALCFSLTLQLAVDRFHMLQTAVYQETRCLGSLLGLFRNLTALDPQAKIPLFEGLLAYTTAFLHTESFCKLLLPRLLRRLPYRLHLCRQRCLMLLLL